MPSPRVSPLVEAHRGDSGNAPENTLAAFRRAVDQGFPWIELDIHPTRDGELVVIHDDRVDRTTDGQGTITELTCAQIRRLDAGRWFAPAFAGEPVPRLAEVIDLVLPTRTRLNIEVKAFPAGTAVPQTLTRLLHATGCAPEFVVSSFDLDALLAVRAEAPEIPLALLGNGPEILPRAMAHHLPWIHAHYSTIDSDRVGRAHKAGIKVNIWTLDDPALVPGFVQAGVDKICSNRPAAIHAALSGAKARTPVATD